MSYWCAARLQPQRERLALHCLDLAGFETYLPRLRERRKSHGRHVEHRSPLFPGYAFVRIELQWHSARWAPGTLGLIMDGLAPARISGAVIAEIRGRERNGLVELPKPGLRRGARVRITSGPLVGLFGLYSGMKPRERVEVLLGLLGGHCTVQLARGAIEAV